MPTGRPGGGRSGRNGTPDLGNSGVERAGFHQQFERSQPAFAVSPSGVPTHMGGDVRMDIIAGLVGVVVAALFGGHCWT